MLFFACFFCFNRSIACQPLKYKAFQVASVFFTLSKKYQKKYHFFIDKLKNILLYNIHSFKDKRILQRWKACKQYQKNQIYHTMKNIIEKTRQECYNNYKSNDSTSLQVAKIKHKNFIVQIEFLRVCDELEKFNAFQILQGRKFLIVALSNSNLFDNTRLYKMVIDCLNGNKYNALTNKERFCK